MVFNWDPESCSIEGFGAFWEDNTHGWVQLGAQSLQVWFSGLGNLGWFFFFLSHLGCWTWPKPQVSQRGEM